MRRYLLILFLLLSCHLLRAQQGNIYFDKYWRKTTAENAAFYRLYWPDNDLYRVEDHYIDGPVYMKGYRLFLESNSVKFREGPITFYDKAGRKTREGHYTLGRRTSTWIYYFDSSEDRLLEIRHPQDTSQPDTSIVYDHVTHRRKKRSTKAGNDTTLTWEINGKDSVLSKTFDYKVGDTTISVTQYPDHRLTRKYGKDDSVGHCVNDNGVRIPCPGNNDTGKFTYTEVMPKADFNLNEYLSKTLVYPKYARKKGIEGRVIVRFVVDEDGGIADVKVMKGIGGGCDEEAERVISEMPYWQPGYQNGRAVRVYYTIPLNFKLQ